MFSAPGAFLWLLLAGPLLALLYLFRQQAPSRPVPSILHLLSVPEPEIPVRRRLARFVRDPLFYVQFLLLLLLVVALAQPVREREAHHVVFVMDTTASMQAREGAVNRLALAVARARGVLDGYGTGDRVAVVAAGKRAELRVAFTSDRRELRSTLDRLSAEDSSGTCAEAVHLAASLLLGAGGGEVVLFTDSPATVPWPLQEEGLSLRIEGVGTEQPNAGVGGLSVSRALFAQEQHLLIEARNWGKDSLESDVVLTLDGVECGRERVSLPAMGGKAITFHVTGKSGLARVSLARPDALDVDNRDFAWLPPQGNGLVQVVSEDSVLADFLDRLGGMKLWRTRPEEFRGHAEKPVELRLFDRWVPERLPDGSAILFEPQSGGHIFDVLGPTTGEIAAWDDDHALLEEVALLNLRVGSFSAVRLGPGWDIVVRSRDSPLLATRTSPEARHVLCAFPLREMLDDPSAVVLFLRMLEWCHAGGGESSFAAGTTFSCRLPEAWPEVTVAAPDGTAQVVRPVGQTLVYRRTASAGPYRVRGPGYERVFVARLDGWEESDLTRVAARAETQAQAARTAPGKVLDSYSPWLLWAAPFLLWGEWVAFLWRRRRGRDARP